MKDNNKFFGRDVYSNPVIVESEKNLSGKIVDVKISNFNHNNFFGQILLDQKESFAA